MSRVTYVVGVLALGAIVATAVSMLSKGRTAPARGLGQTSKLDPSTASELTSLRQRVAELEAERGNAQHVRLIREKVLTARAAQTTREAGGSVTENGKHGDEYGDDDPDRAKVSAAERTEQRLATFRETIETESFDPDWAPTAEQVLASAIAKVEFAGSRFDGQVECRTTLCSAAVLHDDSGAQRRFLSGFPRAARELPNAAFLRQMGEDGQLKTMAFFARDGHPLPQPD